MFKKIAITAILLGLFVAGSLIADDPPGEKWALDIYVTVHVNGTADVDVGYQEVDHTPHMVNHYTGVTNGEIIHYHKDVWQSDPPPYYGFAEGWGTLYGGHDYDIDRIYLGEPLYLELWIGVEPTDPQYPEQ